ncbi:putative sugar O-methyltransferase [Alphaproteobacteria bacterium]|nr:putative sugar O-methyltransferase [Alphaproteobacteria bacterium]
MIQGKISDQVLARYPRLLTENNQRMSEPWYSVDEHTHGRFKFKAPLSAEILSSFRGRRYGGGGVGFDPNDFMISHEDWVRTESEAFVNPRAIDANYDENLRRHVFHLIRELFDKAQDFPIVDKRNLLKLIVDEQPFGADRVPVKIEGKKLPVTVYSARMAPRTMHATAYYQTHASTPMKTVLELGGGFGRCLRDCLSINSIETAYYVDLPLNVGLAAAYLEACFPGRVNLVWDAQDEIILGKINILVPWLIDKINEPIDLMINFLSLQHMPQVTMNHYFDTLISPKVKYLYHENRMQPRSQHEGEGSLLNVAARQQFTIHAGPEMETNLSYNTAGKKIGLAPTIVAEFLVNKALQV